jgi:hypothetical protein
MPALHIVGDNTNNGMAAGTSTKAKKTNLFWLE